MNLSIIYTYFVEKSQKTENVTHWRFWRNCNFLLKVDFWGIFSHELTYLCSYHLFPPIKYMTGASVCDIKNIIGLKKYIIYFLSNNCCDKCPEIEKNVYIYLSKTNNSKNVSVWHWKKFWILTRQSKEVWEVARYVFWTGYQAPWL